MLREFNEDSSNSVISCLLSVNVERTTFPDLASIVSPLTCLASDASL